MHSEDNSSLFTRTEMLIGTDALNILKNASVAVFGIGGVGSFTAEAITRAGVGTVILVDYDTVSVTNINRQIPALHSTVGKLKTDVMKERLQDINPSAVIKTYPLFYNEQTAGEIDISGCSYVIDAIDTVSSKIQLISYCKENNIPIISSMGTGAKLNPLLFRIDDISKTSICPLARVMRRELRNRGIEHVDVLFSTEQPLVKSVPPASISFVPSAAGLIIAGHVIRKLIPLK